jgi:hypothetical protein
MTYCLLQDEKAKRERDRAKWNSLMDEIAKLKTKVPPSVDARHSHLIFPNRTVR